MLSDSAAWPKIQSHFPDDCLIDDRRSAMIPIWHEHILALAAMSVELIEEVLSFCSIRKATRGFHRCTMITVPRLFM